MLSEGSVILWSPPPQTEKRVTHNCRGFIAEASELPGVYHQWRGKGRRRNVVTEEALDFHLKPWYVDGLGGHFSANARGQILKILNCVLRSGLPVVAVDSWYQCCGNYPLTGCLAAPVCMSFQ